ncbi:hypothetical protein JDV02_000285 [Purpureocillium takamizusanense]|uniref:GH64 domain-containing protein n=1 Tax=Purpureocillium takamizusanense TaxID=2060973 RepID=A0A9Q8V5B8_9HYPO|nr:uncharacterized protein JDV02_000285 [Purpureocillium takamizusanense]UNI13550.1 hypothetical protein JDV02_000285 [Purpureocillium takamizusanense]
MPDTLNLVLRNETGAAQLYAHVTGSDDKGIIVMSADGKTPYRPVSPKDTLQPLGADCAIPLGGGGSSRTVTIPRISGGRIWFCKDKPLSFFLNPGPSLVEPSATNPADANYGLDWGFAEFTCNAQELYANVSFVDFVGLPVSLQLTTGDGKVKTVPGMPADGLQQVCAKLEAQGKADGKGWEKLVIRGNGGGAPLRALSPNAGAVLVPGLFDGYYQSYVDAAWAKYAKEDLIVNTQFKWGDVTGRSDGTKLNFKGSDGSTMSFAKPSAADIFTCSTGPFAHAAGVSEEQLNVGARLAAALNRSTLAANARQPEGETVAGYYKEAVTNHYARVCHETSLHGRGYAFPYDDVGASGGTDQSGFVNDPNPKELVVCVGKPLGT